MNVEEPIADLREKLLALTYACPKAKYTPDCPFCVCGGLRYDSRRVGGLRLNHEQLLQLFDLPAGCACPADPRG